MADIKGFLSCRSGFLPACGGSGSVSFCFFMRQRHGGCMNDIRTHPSVVLIEFTPASDVSPVVLFSHFEVTDSDVAFKGRLKKSLGLFQKE